MGDYDYFNAILGGATPEKVGNEYHWPTRDAKSGRILKGLNHPTLLLGLLEEMQLGYSPYIDKSGSLHTFNKEDYMQKALIDYIIGNLGNE